MGIRICGCEIVGVQFRENEANISLPPGVATNVLTLTIEILEPNQVVKLDSMVNLIIETVSGSAVRYLVQYNLNRDNGLLVSQLAGDSFQQNNLQQNVAAPAITPNLTWLDVNPPLGIHNYTIELARFVAPQESGVVNITASTRALNAVITDNIV
jgi:hypothetical protein